MITHEEKRCISSVDGLKRKFIEALTPKGMKNHDGKSFTRRWLLTMCRLFTIILRCNPCGLQVRLDDYYKEIGYRSEVVSKQALSKARINLDPSVLKESFLLTAQTLSSCEDLELYRVKYHLCAIDGSDAVLDNAKELLDHFGGSGPKKDCATALSACCYDPLNNIILDGELYPYGTRERDAAREHLKNVSSLPLPEGVENLYIFDRGYPSKELFAEMIDGKICFLMRVRRKFNVDFEASTRNEKVYFEHDNKQYYVRVFKIILENGDEEILITNLKAKHLSRKEVGALYFHRWRIEVKFGSLKNKLELENMSGRRVVITYQDFWAKLDLANTAVALEYTTDATIEGNIANSNYKHKHRANKNRLIAKLSDKQLHRIADIRRPQRTPGYV